MKRCFFIVLLAAVGLETSPGCSQAPEHRVVAVDDRGGGMNAAASPDAPLPAELPPLPEIAVEAIRLGLEAVARKDWPAAIRQFREAREAAPDDPAVLFRLALAHDRAAHRLPAIACYRAFQAIAPHANNAPLVRERIAQLEKANQEEAYQLALVDLRILEAESGIGAATKTENTWICSQIIRILTKSGHCDEANKLLGAKWTELNVDSATAEILTAMAEGLCELGDYRAAREIADRFPDTDERRKKILSTTLIPQALHGDLREALDFAEAHHLGVVPLARPLAEQGRCIETIDLLYRVSLDDLQTPDVRFALANTLPTLETVPLFAAAGSAIEFFFEHHKSQYKSLVAVVKALTEWGYVAEAEKAASLIEEPHWRFLVDLDILEARARFGQISREQQVREINGRLESVTDVEVKERGCLALVHAQLAMDDLKGAEESASRIKNAGLWEGSPFNRLLPRGGTNSNSDCAKRALFAAQALRGDISRAEATARSSGWSFGYNDRSIEAFFEALKSGGGELDKIIVIKYPSGGWIVPYSVDHDLLHDAVLFHARRDDVEAAGYVAQFHRDLSRITEVRRGVFEGGDKISGGRSQLVIAAALARLGRKAESHKMLAEALTSMGEDVHRLADDLAEQGNIEGLRAIVRQTWENSGGRTLPAVFHRLAQRQRSVSDTQAAEETMRLSAIYSPHAEAADWSATAQRLEQSKVCTTATSDYLREYLSEDRKLPCSNMGTFRAGQLLDIQLELRDRAARWERRMVSASFTPSVKD